MTLSDEIKQEQDHSPLSPFKQQWDAGTNHAVAAPPAETLSASQLILESLRKRRGAETAQWLNNLNSEISHKSPTASQQSLNAVNQQELTPEETREHELVRWLDKLFDQFDLYSSRFNSTAHGTDLYVTCTRPHHMDEQRDNQKIDLYPDPEQPMAAAEKTYEGHLVTRFWAMFIRGTVGTLNIHIFPAEVLLGFSLHKIDESAYKPLLIVESEWSNDKLSWHIAGTNIVINQVPALAKELFGDLIRVASGQMSEDELFAHPLQEMNLGQNLAVGYNKPVQATESFPVGQSPAPSNVAPPNTNTFALSSLNVAQGMLTAMEADINQLFQLGKAALAADNTADFQKIKTVTEKMETLKATLQTTFAEIAQKMQAKIEN